MAKNKLSDVKNHLFAALERLNDEDMSAEEVKAECDRAKAIASVAKQIVEIDRMALQALRMVHNGDASSNEVSNFIQIEAPK